MENYCAFSKEHKCIKWADFETTRYALEEADALCHGNWIEIQRKEEYIKQLQKLLDQENIPYPDEY